MLNFTLVKGKIVLDPNIVLFEELDELYKIKRGESLLRVIYYHHSVDEENPFKDLDKRMVTENILQAVFKKSNWKEIGLTEKEKAKYKAAEKLYIKHNQTAEKRLYISIDKKLDEISFMLDETTPAIEETITKSGEIKFTTNLNIILNLFTKIETILKGKTVLESSIRNTENKGRLRGGGKSSFREKGMIG